jgi:hypothetical protein
VGKKISTTIIENIMEAPQRKAKLELPYDPEKHA